MTAVRPPAADRRPLPEGLPELPKGWVWTRLGAVLADIEAGRSPKNQGRPARGSEFGVLKVSAVSWGEFLPEENKALLPGDEAEPDLTVRAGDLLISRANTTELVGAVVYVERDYPNLMLADKTLRLVPTLDVSAKYLLYALRTTRARDFFAQNATGTSDSMRNISQDKIREVPIPLPPLAEQRRIVERVEALLAQARTAREALAPLPALVRRLRQAVLAAAFSGRLSEREPGDEPAGDLLGRIRAERALLGGRRGREEARALPEGLTGLPEGWAWAQVHEVLASPLANGRSVRDAAEGFPVLRLTAIREGKVDLSQRKTGAWTASQAASFLVQQGDFLIARGNGSRNLVGRGGLVEEAPDPVAYPDTLIRLRVNPDLCDPRFLRHLWQSSIVRQQVGQAAHTTAGIYKVSQEDIQAFVVPLAPLAEQRRIVARVEALLAQADVIEAAVAAVSQRIADVERAVLARAFRGELVEQDVRDEIVKPPSTSPLTKEKK